jgi:predicted PurR-regulated permease PerM
LQSHFSAKNKEKHIEKGLSLVLIYVVAFSIKKLVEQVHDLIKNIQHHEIRGNLRSIQQNNLGKTGQ